MKNITYIILALCLVTVSCKNRKEAKEKQEEARIVEKSKVPVVDDTEGMSPEQAKLSPEDRAIGIAIISISKSVCFGECPAYSAQIFKDGTMLYEGIKSVKNIGKFKGKIDLNTLNGAVDELTSIGFFSLNAVYDNKNVTDLPTTVTYVNNKGKTKKVICRYDCDPRIIKSNKLIESLVNGTKLTKIEK